jgi:hypothetical protein
MNQLLGWLKAGDLTSDGAANEVVRFVSGDLRLLDELIEGLAVEDEAVRGHTADALEKLARSHPDRLLHYLPLLMRSAKEDPIPMVRWHMAMILGHLSIYSDCMEEILAALMELLSDESTFTKSWAIVSLCILARQYPQKVDSIVNAIAPLKTAGSVAIRSKVRKALGILTDEYASFPKGWAKSNRIKSLLQAE